MQGLTLLCSKVAGKGDLQSIELSKGVAGIHAYARAACKICPHVHLTWLAPPRILFRHFRLKALYLDPDRMDMTHSSFQLGFIIYIFSS